VTLPTLGVEEELLLVEPGSGRVCPVAPQALAAHHGRWPPGTSGAPRVEAELFEQQLELASDPCSTLEDLRRSLVRARRAALDAAGAAGALAVAVPTPVLAGGDERLTRKTRYQRILEEYGELARPASVCGMHVHVEVTDEDEAVAVVDGVRPWLPVLLALSANSPYWHGRDTGHASWRSQVWSRWPTGGPREPLGGPADYHETARLLQEWGAAMDDAMLYFDVRLATALPTVEIRVADVCTDVDDAVLVAGLARGLVVTVLREHRATRGVGLSARWRSDLLRAAHWRASRYGVGDTLVHPLRRALAPALEVVEALTEYAADALDEAGDREDLLALARDVVATGGGAGRQRAVHARTGSLEEVLADLADRTARG
jgi:glutamate---cysteine ligase / carboxylate-amine ligase